MKRDSFIFYRSFYEAIKNQDDSAFSEIVKAIIEYALNGIPYSGTNNFAQMAFDLIKPQIDSNNKKYVDGKKGGRPRKNNNNQKPMVSEGNTTGFELEEPNVNDNVNDYVNDYVNDDANGNDNITSHPSLLEIESYINKKGYKDINYISFFNHYESIGWVMNGQPIKNWQALIEKWHAQDTQNKKVSTKSKKKSFTGRDYDFNQLEKELLSN